MSTRDLSNLYSAFEIPAMPELPEFEIPPSIGEQSFDDIKRELEAFELTLNPDEEVGAWLASFGTSVQITVRAVAHAGEYFRFEGVSSDGQQVSLLQHRSQVSLLLLKVKRDPEQPARRIGFLE